MPAILKAALFALGMFLISAWYVRGAVWDMAWHFALRYPNLNKDAISNQVKDRTYSKGWVVSTVLGSLLVGIGFYYSDNDKVFVSCLVSGIAVIFGFIAWKSIKDFRLAIREIGVPWPPHPRDQKWP